MLSLFCMLLYACHSTLNAYHTARFWDKVAHTTQKALDICKQRRAIECPVVGDQCSELRQRNEEHTQLTQQHTQLTQQLLDCRATVGPFVRVSTCAQGGGGGVREGGQRGVRFRPIYLL